jgi:hypothetical protein
MFWRQKNKLDYTSQTPIKIGGEKFYTIDDPINMTIERYNELTNVISLLPEQITPMELKKSRQSIEDSINRVKDGKPSPDLVTIAAIVKEQETRNEEIINPYCYAELISIVNLSEYEVREKGRFIQKEHERKTKLIVKELAKGSFFLHEAGLSNYLSFTAESKEKSSLNTAEFLKILQDGKRRIDKIEELFYSSEEPNKKEN